MESHSPFRRVREPASRSYELVAEASGMAASAQEVSKNCRSPYRRRALTTDLEAANYRRFSLKLKRKTQAYSERPRIRMFVPMRCWPGGGVWV